MAFFNFSLLVGGALGVGFGSGNFGYGFAAFCFGFLAVMITPTSK